jgi:hypothetical protein
MNTPTKIKKKRSNHFLPICYQKSFTDAEGQLWVQYLHKDGPPQHLNPIVVGVMNKFYTQYINGIEDDSIENAFQSLVEDDYAPIAKRIKEEKIDFTLTKEDVSILLKFVASQVVRTEAHRRCIDEQAGIAVGSDIFLHNMGRKLLKIIRAWQVRVPDIQLYTSLPLFGIHFITGDSPVVTFGGTVENIAVERPFDMQSIVNIDKILEDPNSGFIVPLSPYVCVFVRNGGTGQIMRSPQSRPPEFVSKTNELLYAQCVQFVEAMDEKSLAFHKRNPDQKAKFVSSGN